MTEVTVIGAGVAGLAVTRALLDRGAQVRLVDRNGPPGAHGCSWWAGGMLAPFCEGESAEEPVVRLGQRAADWWDKHTGLVQRHGSLVVSAARDHGDLKRFARRTDHFREVSGPEITALEPDLGTRFSRGLFFDTEAHLSPRAALAALFESVTKDGTQFEVAEVAPDAQDGLVVDCRGYAARDATPELRGALALDHRIDFEFHQPFRVHKSPDFHDRVHRADIAKVLFAHINGGFPVIYICQNDPRADHILQSRPRLFQRRLDDLDTLTGLRANIADPDCLAIRAHGRGSANRNERPYAHSSRKTDHPFHRIAV